MKYESELIKEIADSRGHDKSSLHYESECIESWIEEAKGAYPKLCDYQSEWLEYISILDDTGGGKDPEPPGGGEEPKPEPPGGGGEEPEPEEPPIGQFPYETVTTNNTATVNHAVPLAYKSAILKGNTKYHDIDTGDILDTYDETKNLGLVSVQTPVLMIYNYKNLFNDFIKDGSQWGYDYSCTTTDVNYNQNGGYVKIIGGSNLCYSGFVSPLLSRGTYKFSCKVKVGQVGDSYRILTHNNPNGAANNANGFVSVKITSTKEIETFEYVGYFKGANNILLYTYYKGQEIEYYDIMFTKLSDEDVTNDVQNYTYQSNILTVNEDVKLRRFGDIQDTLNCLTGELTERVAEVVLDGSEGWIAEDQRFSLVGIENLLPNRWSLLLSDKYPSYSSLNSVTQYPSYIIGNGWAKCILIRDEALFPNPKNQLSEFKEYLSQNPITIQYQSATESIKTVNLTVVNQDGKPLSKIKPIEGTMHISVSGTPINPTAVLEVPVEAITQNLNSFIGEE